SEAIRSLGLAPLTPETSQNLSLGLRFQPARPVNISLNAYEITIRNRIVGSGTLYGFGAPDGRNSDAVLEAITARGIALDRHVTRASLSVFTNGLNTRTRGLELLMNADWATEAYRLHVSLSGNASLTRVIHMRATPTQLQPQSLFDPFTMSNLEDASPAYRWILSTQMTHDPWRLNLRATLNGRTSNTILSNMYSENGVTYPAEWIRSVIHPHMIFDAELGYQFTPHLSLFVGANNMFNLYPEKLDPRLLHSFVATTSNQAVYDYATWSPFGINGGYYYSRLKVDF
ncbi:MAG: TonB-dependent receptor, partial [Asticcacaulis sp.]